MKKLFTAGLLAVMSTATLAAGPEALVAPAVAAPAPAAAEEKPLTLSAPLIGDVTVSTAVVVGMAVVGAAVAAGNSGGSSHGGATGPTGTTGTTGTH